MSGLVGSLESASKRFDDINPKDIREGIKGCMQFESRIEEAEKEAIAEKQKVTISDEQTLENLSNEIRGDMGEEPITDRNKTDDEEREL